MKWSAVMVEFRRNDMNRSALFCCDNEREAKELMEKCAHNGMIPMRPGAPVDGQLGPGKVTYWDLSQMG